MLERPPAAGRDAGGALRAARNDFVASFIGSPSINMVEAELARSDGGLAVSFGGHTLAVDETRRGRARARRLRRPDRPARHPAGGPRGRPGRARRAGRPQDPDGLRPERVARRGGARLLRGGGHGRRSRSSSTRRRRDGPVEHAPPTRRKTPGTSRFVARVSPRAPSAEGSRRRARGRHAAVCTSSTPRPGWRRGLALDRTGGEAGDDAASGG